MILSDALALVTVGASWGGVVPIPSVTERHRTPPSRRGMYLGWYIPYPFSCLPSPSISYWTEGSINPCKKYLRQQNIWWCLRLKFLHVFIQKIGMDSSVIAQFIDVLRLGTLFRVLFIIVRWVGSKSPTGVRVSEVRMWQKIEIGGWWVDPSLSPKCTPHCGLCVCVPCMERELWREGYRFSVPAFYTFLS